MPPLRIAYSFPTRLGTPGIGTTAWNQVVGLVSLGVEVDLYCGSLERPIAGLASLTQTMSAGPFKIPYRLFGDDRVFSYHDWRVARDLTRRVSLVHCWPLGAQGTLAKARQLGIQGFLERPNAHTGFAYEVVRHEHERIGLPIPSTHTHWHNPRRLARELREYQQASKLACPSDFVARSFSDRGWPATSLIRHQYGCDLKKFRPTPEPQSRPFTVAFVGRCEPRKGLHYALEAWHRSGAASHGRFRIVGTFIEEYEAHLRTWLNHRSIERIGFTDDVVSIMQSSDVLILPSIEEGSALVTYEARACGCVLVVSDATGAICTHALNGLIHRSGDVDALTEHLSTLVSNPSQLAALRERSLATREELSWETAAQIMLKNYRSAIESTNRPHVDGKRIHAA